jgi:hypothetical protein
MGPVFTTRVHPHPAEKFGSREISLPLGTKLSPRGEQSPRSSPLRTRSNLYKSAGANRGSSLLDANFIPRSSPLRPRLNTVLRLPGRRGLVVQSPPATEEIGAMGRGIVYRQAIE